MSITQILGEKAIFQGAHCYYPPSDSRVGQGHCPDHSQGQPLWLPEKEGGRKTRPYYISDRYF